MRKNDIRDRQLQEKAAGEMMRGVEMEIECSEIGDGAGYVCRWE